MKRLSHKRQCDIKTEITETQLDGCSQIYVAAESAKFIFFCEHCNDHTASEFVDQINFSFSRKILHQ
jgi:hypothetical protein